MSIYHIVYTSGARVGSRALEMESPEAGPVATCSWASRLDSRAQYPRTGIDPGIADGRALREGLWSMTPRRRRRAALPWDVWSVSVANAAMVGWTPLERGTMLDSCLFLVLTRPVSAPLPSSRQWLVQYDLHFSASGRLPTIVRPLRRCQLTNCVAAKF